MPAAAAAAVIPPLPELAERVRRLAVPGRRTLVGIAGAPGAGKSRLASALASELGGVVVPMDGFHLPDNRLRELGRMDRKGAPDTFDADGYVALLQRLREGDEPVLAPAFDRSLECVLPDAVVVPADAVVITEGNYLLLDVAPWSQLRGLLDAAWFVATEEALRVERLIARYVCYGWDPAAARERVSTGSDADNARLATVSSARAALTVRR